ncbi:MAG: hypothetical protein HKN25_01075 [Pyrinomonadaceae bacterium]|nr:hypothetical protein [Pyrinomonadaceae bacterium]
MRFQSLLFIFALAASTLLFSCSGGEQDKKPEENKEVTANKSNEKSKGNSNVPAGTSRTPTPETVNQAETVKPVVEAYCIAMQKRDESSLRKIYSSASLRQLDADMRADGVRSLTEYLSNEPVGNKCSVRNEKIAGNAAIALVTTQTYPNGIQWKFIKEKGEWKMTNQSSDFDAVRKATKKSGK